VQKEEPNEAKWENQTGFTRKTIWPSYGFFPFVSRLGPKPEPLIGPVDYPWSMAKSAIAAGPIDERMELPVADIFRQRP
jgi:hypothetical protein